EHQSAGAITEENAGRAIGPIKDTRESFGTNHQNALCHATADVKICGCQRVNETRTNCLNVEGKAVSDSKTVLDVHSGCWKCIVRCRSRNDDEIDVLRI